VAIANPVIVRKPSMKVSYPPVGGTGQATEVDISCAVRSLEFTEDEEIIDVPTFCSPEATASGKQSTSATVAVYWTDELVDALTPHLNEEGTFTVVYNESDTKATEFKGTIAKVPFGTIEPGKPIEADLTISVTEAPHRVAVTAP
jgi:hypothetical protein